MNIRIYLSSAFAAGLLLTGACSDDNEIVYPEGQGIVIETPVVAESGSTYATLASLFHMKGDAHYTKAGYVVSTDPNPTIYGSVYDATVSGDTIKVTLSDLAPSREYHIRAFMNGIKVESYIRKMW